jgi:DNA polymerase I-like protein with 3'-5' exonuclease and polymerase domains
MLYGMGAKALGEALNVSTEEAASFQDSFKKRYKGVTKYLERSVKECQKKMYIETIGGRRRYFPLINSKDTLERAAAERAVRSPPLLATNISPPHY